jgi:stress-induced morphogen
MLSHEIKNRIENGIPRSECFVNEFLGGSDHYAVIVVSDSFEGQTLLSRHRMIMDLFKEEMATGEVHALTIKAFTQKQWVTEKNNHVKKPMPS